MGTKQVFRQQFTILLDMDGVLADFVGGVEEEFNVELSGLDHWGMWDEIGITPAEFWGQIRENPRFWADLKPYPWARDLVNMVDEIAKGDTAIVTSPDTSVTCASQKVYWLNNHFPQYNRKYFIGARKELMANRTTILIDDSQKNIDKFRERGGIGIVFPQLWNSQERKPTVDVVDELRSAIEGKIEQYHTAQAN